MTTRAEHLDWCKKRAFECLDRGDLEQALVSMISGLSKHEETRVHPGIAAGLGFVMGLMMVGAIDTPEQMRNFLDDFR